jgi:hypothetical protein
MKSLKELTERSVAVKDYLTHTTGPFRDKANERMKTYKIDASVIEELKKYVNKLFVIVFSAEWCLKDCAPNVPVLALLANKTGLNVRVFGGLTRDPSNPKERWKVPPSPPEVKDFKVEKVPTIIIFDANGRELGKIIENPAPNKTIEEGILEFARRA